MGALFSDKYSSKRPAGATAPPPPPGAASSFFDDDSDAPPAPKLPRRPAGVRFDAELDLCELDDRDRPGPTWIGRGRELSRAHMTFRSRRMCYTGRRILAAVHLVDDQPVPLFGRVVACEYDGDGAYRTEIELMQVPEKPEIASWLGDRGR